MDVNVLDHKVHSGTSGIMAKKGNAMKSHPHQADAWVRTDLYTIQPTIRHMTWSYKVTTSHGSPGFSTIRIQTNDCHPFMITMNAF